MIINNDFILESEKQVSSTVFLCEHMLTELIVAPYQQQSVTGLFKII